MAPVILSPPNFSKTQRLVLLIDLDPLLTFQNPSSYLAAVTSVADRLLQFPPLSASLSAFKLFFSSLSPLRSAAVLPRHLTTPFLSFNLPPQTLDSLSSTFKSISNLIDLPNSPCCPRASYAASSLIQLIHDYAWETEKDNLSGENDLVDGELMKIPSNLVILLSPIAQSVNLLVDYLEMREFDEVFCAVREAFVVRDIHLCWVDVNCDALDIEGVDVKKNERGDNLLSLTNVIRKMGWGFCSSDLIVLGSALLPLGLIYPKIGVPFDFVNFGGGTTKKKYFGELSLEILDVNGMPLDCKCCDLDFVNINKLACSIRNFYISDDTEFRDPQSLQGQDGFWLRLGTGKAKLHVKSVHRFDEYKMTGVLSETVLVRECFQQSGKNKTNSSDDFFADGVLEMLHGEMGGATCRNQLPIWQMFLSFLHMKGFWAFVSLSGSSEEDKLMGCLKPFTTHLAVLDILNINDLHMCRGSQAGTSPSGNCVLDGDGKMKKSQRNLYQKMTWSSFCKAALGGSNFDLFELYVARYFEKSKKLKFFKCWMKQISKVDVNFSKPLPGFKSMEDLSACNAIPFKPSPAKEGGQSVLNSETSESFFNNLSKKIQHGLESGMDLQNLAECVVKSSVHWLHRNREIENDSEGQQESARISDDTYSEVVAGKLIELLLRSSKEMKKIQQDPDSFSSENIVREYELQILLRIEILRSDVSAMLGESRKKKLMKQICALLEIIQYLVAGGIHGHVSLYDYIERTIRSRYSNELDDVVKKIYIKMDLLPFGDEEQAPSFLFNSEDSNQSWRDKHDRNEKAEANSINHSFSTEGDSSQPPTNPCDSPKNTVQDEYTQILNEARERRERARRFAPFVSKARDLQRVWAPKQPKAVKGKFDPLPNKSKRTKDRQTAKYSSSVVCETPMTGHKRAYSRENKNGDKSRNDIGNSSSSVSKALFQDN
ncbi:hypothetical protein PHJA_000248700 [Phtheirospermum japonicum]|uniref:Treslin n=1 Tax=Phtheirospermum japonicum TaxID=374723 RepID=A0A830B8L9_9LAMI|nr:hypothetical protein PHJA_000248700 [Phtheirospermum japonicum]